MVKSQWNRGVALYTKELLENLFMNYSQIEIINLVTNEFGVFDQALLFGAKSWKQYSEGGCALIYEEDIAGRLYPASKIRCLKDGSIANPSKNITWIDVQADALAQASRRVYNICRNRVFASIDKNKVFEDVTKECAEAGC